MSTFAIELNTLVNYYFEKIEMSIEQEQEKPLERIFLNNFKDILAKHSMRPGSFSDLCNKNGIDVGRSFLSRINSYSVGFSLSKYHDIYLGITLLEPSLEPSDMLIPNLLEYMKTKEESLKKQVISTEDLSKAVGEIIFNLVELNWIEIPEKVPFEIVRDFVKNELSKKIPISISYNTEPQKKVI